MKLQDYRSGQYINKDDYQTFVPAKINHVWQWDNPVIDRLLHEAIFELGRLQNYVEQVENIDVYIKMHIRTEANKSSKIEGTKTSIQEDLMKIEDLAPEKRDDAIEVANYVEALQHGVHRIMKDDFPLSSRLIREIHQKLMSGVRGEHKTPGEYRRSQNWIGGSKPSNAAFVPPSYEYLADLISDLEQFIHNDDIYVHALIKNAIIHYQFETIHPFLDGNGRTGRILIPLLMLNDKLIDKPCFYISDYFERHRLHYYETLNRVRAENDMTDWIIFFLKASIETAIKAKDKFKRAIELKNTLRAQVGDIPGSVPNVIAILDAFFTSPILSTNEVVDYTGISKPTVNRTLKAMFEMGYLDEVTGFTRNRVYVLKDYINVFV